MLLLVCPSACPMLCPMLCPWLSIFEMNHKPFRARASGVRHPLVFKECYAEPAVATLPAR
jgi:hypothetical protein